MINTSIFSKLKYTTLPKTRLKIFTEDLLRNVFEVTSQCKTHNNHIIPASFYGNWVKKQKKKSIREHSISYQKVFDSNISKIKLDNFCSNMDIFTQPLEDIFTNSKNSDIKNNEKSELLSCLDIAIKENLFFSTPIIQSNKIQLNYRLHYYNNYSNMHYASAKSKELKNSAGNKVDVDNYLSFLFARSELFPTLISNDNKTIAITILNKISIQHKKYRKYIQLILQPFLKYLFFSNEIKKIVNNKIAVNILIKKIIYAIKKTKENNSYYIKFIISLFVTINIDKWRYKMRKRTNIIICSNESNFITKVAPLVYGRPENSFLFLAYSPRILVVNMKPNQNLLKSFSILGNPSLNLYQEWQNILINSYNEHLAYDCIKNKSLFITMEKP